VNERLKEQAQTLLRRLEAWNGKPLTFMEVCGTHTVSAARSGLHASLPRHIKLISGPGCPVCVTHVGYIDHAIALAGHQGITIATFGDLMRVPGSSRANESPSSLVQAQAKGADIRVVYSAMEALKMAEKTKPKEVVFLSVGFETTTPTIASTILLAAAQNIENLSVLTANKTIINALKLLGTSTENRIDGFLCPGHVSVIIGADAYRELPEQNAIACAIAGFEPIEMLRAIVALTEQIADQQPAVVNCYEGAVRAEGNPRARELMNRVFESCDSEWRGLGRIPESGLKLRRQYRRFDAAYRFDVSIPDPEEPVGCRCGEVLRGLITPQQCSLFGKGCTPEAPRGACMVSSEGSCAAHYHYAGNRSRRL